MDGKPVCDSRDGKGDGWRESHDVMQELAGVRKGSEEGMEGGEGGWSVVYRMDITNTSRSMLRRSTNLK